MKKKLLVLIIIVAISFLFISCSKNEEKIEYPHEGEVYLYDGFDWIWYKPIEGLEVNALTKEDFEYYDNIPHYVGDEFDVLTGIDVSEHQLNIDWNTVINQNYDFVYIRLGRRGYTEGGIYLDEYFIRNYESVKNSNMDIGVYFFSQAITVSEAIEEANYVLDYIKDKKIDLPIAFDFEKIEDSSARTANMSKESITDCAIAFCETIKSAGYEPVIYYNRTFGYYKYDLSRLKDYKVWYSLPCTPPDVTFPSFYYHIDYWQFSQSEIIPGIQVETDLNYIFIPKN